MRRVLTILLVASLLLQPTVALADPELEENPFVEEFREVLALIVAGIPGPLAAVAAAADQIVPYLWSLYLIVRLISWALGIREELGEVLRILFYICLLTTVLSFVGDWLASKILEWLP